MARKMIKDSQSNYKENKQNVKHKILFNHENT